MNIKKKIQHFIWCACHDILPVLSSLVKRKMKVDIRCKLCGEGEETIEHLFFDCSEAKATWKLALVQWDGLDQYTTSFMEWWTKLELAAKREELGDRKELSAYILWHLWKNRNKWNFHSVKNTTIDVV